MYSRRENGRVGNERWKNQAWFRSAARYFQWRFGRYILYFKVDFLKDFQHNDRIPEKTFLECSVALVTEKSVFGKVQKATYIKTHLIIGWSEVNWTIKKSKRNLPGGLTNRTWYNLNSQSQFHPLGVLLLPLVFTEALHHISSFATTGGFMICWSLMIRLWQIEIWK